jgi:hypothetical protein
MLQLLAAAAPCHAQQQQQQGCKAPPAADRRPHVDVTAGASQRLWAHSEYTELQRGPAAELGLDRVGAVSQ